MISYITRLSLSHSKNLTAVNHIFSYTVYIQIFLIDPKIFFIVVLLLSLFYIFYESNTRLLIAFGCHGMGAFKNSQSDFDNPPLPFLLTAREIETYSAHPQA